MKETQLNFLGVEDDRNLQKKRHTIVFPIDTLILLSIVVILLFILSFSLGVERGRKIAYLSIEKDKKFFKETESLAIDSSSSQITIIQPEKKNQVIEESENKQEVKPPIEETPKWQDTEKYLIQVATYVKEQTAQQEVEKLQGKGYQTLVSKKGKFVVIFVGEFKDKEEAKKSMELLKKSYKDCFIRRL